MRRLLYATGQVVMFAVIVGFGGLMSWMVWEAGRHDWTILIDFNVVGEGPLERVLFPVLTIVAALAWWRGRD